MGLVKAYIQHKDGQCINVNAFTAQEGFNLLGVETVGFEAHELESLPLGNTTVVHGYVGVVRRALARVGAPVPDVHPAPPELRAFLGRRLWETDLGEIRRAAEPVFIKPLRDHKRFTGYVRRGELEDINRTAHLDDDFEVIASEVVGFISEWRCFVLEGACIGARPYAGSYKAPCPDCSLVDACIEAFGRAAPAAYSIDLGRLSDGSTVLVEVNDSFSLGCYGLPPIPYARMIEARWLEMVGSGR